MLPLAMIVPLWIEYPLLGQQRAAEAVQGRKFFHHRHMSTPYLWAW